MHISFNMMYGSLENITIHTHTLLTQAHKRCEKPTVSLTNSTGITNLGDDSEEKDLDTARRTDGMMLRLAAKVSIDRGGWVMGGGGKRKATQ